MNRRKFLKTAVAVMATAVVGAGCTPQPKFPPPPPKPRVVYHSIGPAHRDLVELMRDRCVKEMMLEEDQRFLMSIRAAA